MATFSDGYKFDAGQRIKAVRTVTNLSSNGYTKYTTILWADGTASCDCPGWCRQLKEQVANGYTLKLRRCRHTDDLAPTKPWVESKTPILNPSRVPPIRKNKTGRTWDDDDLEAVPPVVQRILNPLDALREQIEERKSRPKPQTQPVVPSKKRLISMDEEVL